MTRLFHTSFALLLILAMGVSTTGLTFMHHYCNGSLVSTRVMTETDPCCNIQKKAPTCCQSKLVYLKLETDKKTTEPLSFDDFQLPLVALISEVQQFSKKESHTPFYTSGRAPPGKQKLYTTHCSFLFYG